jgi:pullulanase/glycogen debranching enzyme
MEPQRLIVNYPVKVELHPGRPLPLGTTVRPGGVNFAIASRYATAVTLLIFIPGEEEAAGDQDRLGDAPAAARYCAGAP